MNTLLRLHFWQQESCQDKDSAPWTTHFPLSTRELNEDICQPDKNTASSQLPPFCHPAIITFTCNHNQEASFSLLNSDLCPTGGFPNLITKRRFEAPKIGRKLINNEN